MNSSDTLVLSIAVESASEADLQKVNIALDRLAQEDPSLRVWIEDGQTHIAGTSELHLDGIVDRMRREFGVEANIGAPQVAYHETIRAEVKDIEGKLVKQSGGRGLYGHVVIDLFPLEEGAGYSFTNNITEGQVPSEFIPAIEAGIQQERKSGPLAGYAVADVGVRLQFGSHHEVDSSELAFQLAASMAFKDGILRANPVLLEPVMAVTAETPEDCLNDVIGDLIRRRGVIEGTEDGPSGKVVRALAPLAELLGYATHLRFATQGRASCSMEPHRYVEVPTDIANVVIEARRR